MPRFYQATRDIRSGTVLAFAEGDVIPEDNYKNLGLSKDDAKLITTAEAEAAQPALAGE